jgi:hypothetical protein
MQRRQQKQLKQKQRQEEEEEEKEVLSCVVCKKQTATTTTTEKRKELDVTFTEVRYRLINESITREGRKKVWSSTSRKSPKFVLCQDCWLDVWGYIVHREQRIADARKLVSELEKKK